MKRLSVILPTRNEEMHIENVVRNILYFLKNKKYTYEILVVINGSTDNTLSIVDDLVKEFNGKIKIIKSKAGYGYALRKGLLSSKGKYICIYNVDFYDLELLNLIDSHMYGRDLIIGSKRAHWSLDKRPVSRKLISFLFNNFIKFFFGFKGSDTHGIKLLNRKVVDVVYPKCVTNSGIFDTEFVIKTQRENFKIADFPVNLSEIRSSRFPSRWWQTPVDIINLYKSLQIK